MTEDSPFIVAGAGLAGLAAAVTLAAAGRAVTVVEVHPRHGRRYQRSYQILENYSRRGDVLEEFAAMGLSTAFFRRPGYAVDFHGPGRVHRMMRSRTPFGYYIQRGAAADTLDAALYDQARSLGVQFRFGARTDPAAADIDATGTRQASGYSREIVFQTAAPDQYHVVLDNRITPRGFAYVFIIEGRGTIGAAVMADFKRLPEYARRATARLQAIGGFDMREPRETSAGVGFYLARTARRGRALRVGEAAGFQDYLFGLGIRRVVESGVLAARSLLEGTDYDARWQRSFGAAMRAGIVNRFLYEAGGNAGYRLFIRLAAWGDFRTVGHWLHRLTPERRLLWPLVAWLWRKPHACRHGAVCVWCRNPRGV